MGTSGDFLRSLGSRVTVAAQMSSVKAETVYNDHYSGPVDCRAAIFHDNGVESPSGEFGDGSLECLDMDE